MKRSIKNNTKKVCILRSNPVNPDSRVEKEAEALCAAGYLVEIFCWDRESNHKVKKEFVHNKIPVYRYGAKATYGGGFRNILPYLKFQVRMFIWLLRNSGRYSVIHACDFDTAFFSYLPSRIRGCSFVFDIFDYLCGDPRGFFQRTVKQSENWLIDHSDATIICTEQRKQQIRGTSPKRLVVIHNSPDINISKTSSPVIVDKSRISVVYVGVLLDNRLLSEILSYFMENDNIDYYIGGFGMLEEEVKYASEKHPNIHFVGKTSYEQTISLESECDIMTSIYDPSVENHVYAASNKFYESLMLGKPVIMVRGTGMSDCVEEHKIGSLIDYSKEGFSKGLSELIERKQEWGIIKEKMNRLYSEKYSWNKMKRRLLELYANLE